jgi:serine/threonine-protein kinase
MLRTPGKAGLPKPGNPASSGKEPARRASPIPGFTLEREVGRGGMGIVYRARQTSIGRVVAVKVLPPAATKNQQFVERFLREAKAAAKLNHENVVAAIDAGRAGDIVYFVMEFVDGETARERLDREGPLPVEDVVRILRDTARALVHAQKHSLVHRDVKPDNIMLNKDGRAQLCDLGLARLAPQRGDAQAAAKTGIAEGTPYYMAPEQARGFADIDIRADLYALGVTAYHLLTGEYPFDGDDARAVMVKAVNDPFPDIAAKRPDLPRGLVDLIARLVEKDREKRLASPEEAVRALDALEAPAPAPVAAPAAPSNRAAIFAGAATGALVLALLVSKLFGGKTPPAPEPGSEPAPRPAVVARHDEPRPAEPPAAGPEPAPARPAASAREAEAALKLKSLRLELGPQAEPRRASARLREVAQAYPGTRAATDAEDEARAIEDRQADALERKMKDLAPMADDLLARGEFAGAAAKYAPLLAQEKGGPGEDRVGSEVARIEGLCADAEKKAEARAKSLAAKEKFEEAAKVLDDFAAKATDAPKAEARKLLAALTDSRVSAEAAKDAKEAADGVRALLRAGRYDDALAALDKAAADPRFQPFKAGIDSMRAQVVLLKQSADAVRARFAALAGQDVEVPLLVGETLKGRAQDFDAATLALRIREAGAKEPVPVRLREMQGPYVVSALGHAHGDGGHLGAGLVLLYAQAVAAAASELELARADAPLPPSVEAELKQAQDGLPEVAAAAALDRAQALLLEKGRHERALACAEKLRAGEWKDTAFAKAHAADLRAAWTKARARELEEGPLQAFFEGKLAGKRGQRVTVTYGFAEAREALDWRADDKAEGFSGSKVTPLANSVELTGRVVWRGQFKGDVEVQALVRTVASNGLVTTPANANFVIYDRGAPWTGWFCGVAATCPESSTFHLSPRAVMRPGAVFESPSHMIGRAQGTYNTTEWLWASRGPAVPGGRPYKIEIATKAHRFLAAFLEAPIPPIPMPAEDQAGGIAVVPFSSKVTLEQVKLQGTLDEAWLEREALARAEADFQK